MTKMIDLKKIIQEMSNSELWVNQALTIKELKSRKLIRTRNITGERGEQLAIEIYNSTPNEPNLQAAPEGTRNVDALSRKGDRYSVKTITVPGKLTGVVYGLNPPGDTSKEDKKFEYLIIVIMDDLYQPVKILECDWSTFLKFKKWHKTMRAWNISITKEFVKECRQVYPKNKD